ncbi:MAG: hypothetical protein WCT31_05080 [Candidatus Micrarchaeia archaeon]
MHLFQLPPNSPFRLQYRNSFPVIGEGIIGGKAEGFVRRRDAIVDSGFLIPETAFLATGFLLQLLEQAMEIARVSLPTDSKFRTPGFNLPYHLVRKSICLAEFSTLHDAVLNELMRDLLGFFAVRSSHKDESGGDGKYFSGFSQCQSEALSEAIKRVLVSSLDMDMGVILQNAVWEKLNIDGINYPSPILAGCAYSTRIDNGEGKIVLTPGFGTRAVHDGGDRYYFRGKDVRLAKENSNPRRFDYLASSGCLEDHVLDGAAFASFVSARTHLLSLLPEMLRKLEALAGGPQYIEFAMTNAGIFCLQIADTQVLKDFSLDSTFKGRTLATSNVVGGMGRKKIIHLVVLDGRVSSDKFRQMDNKLHDYLLVVPVSRFSCAHDRLQRSDIPNSSGVAAIRCARCDADPRMLSYEDADAGEHLLGALGHTPFLLINSRSQLTLDSFPSRKIGGFTIYDVDMTLEVKESEAYGRVFVN